MPIGETKQSLWLFGQEYLKKIDKSGRNPVGLAVAHPHVFISPSHTNHHLHHPKTQNLVTSFLKRTARSYLLPRVQQLAETMQTQPKQIRLKETKTRWGSCSSKGNLNFNWRLVHFPTKIIDYVVIHELAHLTHLDHSAAFWNLVGKFDPEYPKHRGWLKRWPRRFLTSSS